MKDVAFWTALFAALSVGTIAYELRREVVPIWRLFVAPVAALAAAISLPSEPRWLALAVAGLVIGFVAGSIRGLSTTLRVDHIWQLVRLRRAAYDGVVFSLLIAVLAGAGTEPAMAFLAQRMQSLPFAGLAFGCAGYLLGRAAAITLRSRNTPHDDMRPNAV